MSRYDRFMARVEAIDRRAGFDALAYDQVTQSPTLGRKVEASQAAFQTANGEVVEGLGSRPLPKVTVRTVLDIKLIAQGRQLVPESREWRDHNSINGILLPTYLQRTRIG